MGQMWVCTRAVLSGELWSRPGQSQQDSPVVGKPAEGAAAAAVPPTQGASSAPPCGRL